MAAVFPFHLANLMHEILWGVKVHMLEMDDVMALGMMKRSADLRRRATCCCATCCCVTCVGDARCAVGERAVCDARCATRDARRAVRSDSLGHHKLR